MLPYRQMDPNFSLEGKVAIITGGASGIGYATAQLFVKKGARCVLADLKPDADEIAKALSSDCMGISGNINDASYRARVIEETAAQYGTIDILVNNAGIALLDAATDVTVSDWDIMMNLNLKSAFFMAQAVGRYMIENQIAGSIVNLASQAGVIALDRHVVYCASKAAIISMTQVLAYEWGKYGIRINAVSPTVVLTELGHRVWDGPVGDAFKEQIPARRFAEPEEIASVIAFLNSSGAAMVTGHNLLIDGGYTIQ